MRSVSPRPVPTARQHVSLAVEAPEPYRWVQLYATSLVRATAQRRCGTPRHDSSPYRSAREDAQLTTRRRAVSGAAAGRERALTGGRRYSPPPSAAFTPT